jgi:TetR/AcrR family transcriptional repressor of nem operon
MGHSKASKDNTHARLVHAAASAFKDKGIDGIGVADLMKELDLTHGGFYKHFASRDALVTEALDLALSGTGAAMRERLFKGGRPTLAGFVNFYLDDAHRSGRADGCAVAALAGDAARKGADVQSQFREQIDRNLQSLSEAMTQDATRSESRGESRAAAMVLLSTLYGALIMARAVGDSPLSREILRTVRKQILQPGTSASRQGSQEVGTPKPRTTKPSGSRRIGTQGSRTAPSRKPTTPGLQAGGRVRAKAVADV